MIIIILLLLTLRNQLVGGVLIERLCLLASELRLRYVLQPRDMHVLYVNPALIPTEVQKHRDLIHAHRGVAYVAIQLGFLGWSHN